MDNSDAKNYANKLADEAQYMDWKSLSTTVSHDVTTTRIKLESFKTEYKQDMKMIKAELQNSKELNQMTIQFFLAVLVALIAILLTPEFLKKKILRKKKQGNKS